MDAGGDRRGGEEQLAELAAGEHEQAHRGGRDDGRAALPARAEQADLAEEVAGLEAADALAVALDVRRALDHDEELPRVAALAGQLRAVGHADLVGQARDVPAPAPGDRCEQRDRLDGAQFHGARLR